MAPESWRKAPGVIDHLLARPGDFDFIQAVRLLESYCLKRKQATDLIGDAASPDKECLRFSADTSLTVRTRDIGAVSKQRASGANSRDAFQLATSIMTLAGASGVLPYHLTELIISRLRLRDDALLEFLDLFNHRVISLFYKSVRKYALPLNFEAYRIGGRRRRDPITELLLSLSGFGNQALLDLVEIEPDALASVSGILSRPIQSASALAGMLQHFLQIPVTIQQFQATRLDIPEELQMRIASGPQQAKNNQLGVNTILGGSGWSVQSKFSIELQVDDHRRLQSLRPDGAKMKSLRSLARIAGGNEYEFDIKIKTPSSDIPRLKLESRGDYRPMLGWNSMLGGLRQSTHMTVVIH